MGGEWVTRKIRDLGKVITGKTPSTKVPEYFGGIYPFITIPDLDGRRDISTEILSNVVDERWRVFFKCFMHMLLN